MSKKWGFILGIGLAAALFSPVLAQAATLYVNNTSACPGNGLTGTPFCSLQNAFNVVNAGDTIRIRTGTGVYNQAASVVNRSGTAGNPIILEPDVGASFIITNNNAEANQAAILIQDSDYWTIRNLTFDGNGVQTSIYALKISPENRTITNIQITGNTFKRWGGTTTQDVIPVALQFSSGCIPGLGCGGSPRYTNNALVQNNVFDNNRRLSIAPVMTQNSVIDSNEIKNNKCGRNGRSGDTSAFNVGMHATYNNVNLTISNNQLHDFDNADNCTIPNQGYATLAAIWSDVCSADSSFTIKNNKVWNISQAKTNQTNQFGLNWASMGLFIEAGCQATNSSNNLIYNIGNFGVRNDYHSLNLSQRPNIYTNNTIYNTGINAYKVTYGVLTIENSIHVSPTIHDFIHVDNPSYVRLTADYNLYYATTQSFFNVLGGTGLTTLSSWQSACNCDSHSLNVIPLFVNEGAADFHLQASSPAIGAAKNGGDMGAYPFDSSQTLDAPTNLRIIQN
jgi:hypothetical protein